MEDKNEIMFEDDDCDISEIMIRNSVLNLDVEDLPITVTLEGRKKYILKKTENDCLILNKKE